jgi:trehalose 6-phosphate synthase
MVQAGSPLSHAAADGTRRARLVVVANRLPVERATTTDGSQAWRRCVGGMVSALEPVLDTGDVWIGWDGLRRPHAAASSLSQVAAGHSPCPGVRLHQLRLTRTQVEAYYDGYANQTLWPLYHDRVADDLARPRFERAWWTTYQQVNRTFAAAAAEVAPPGATVWVNDYHLQLVPAMIRALRSDIRIGFFLYIPVPTVQHFADLPEHAEILRGVLGADLIGVNRPADMRAFLRLVGEELGLHSTDGVLDYDNRRVEVQAFPYSVDVGYIQECAERALACNEPNRIRKQYGEPRTLIVGVERLDYTKGIGERLEAFRTLLADGRLDPCETVHVQVAAPSREGITAYRTLSDRITEQVRMINMEFGRPGRPVVHYINEALPRDELIPLYLAADVMAVTPLRDGMNLVAKEYVAARVDVGGALVLSMSAGAADDLEQAYLVDPSEPRALADTLARAAHATPAERATRMRALRAGLVGHDAKRWGDGFLRRLGAQRLDHGA